MVEEKKPIKPKKEAQKEKTSPSSEIVDFRVGDRIGVYFTIKEEKQIREAFFEGQVISQKGAGNSETFTVRRIAADRIPVERIFPKKSPKITKIVLLEKGKKIRRAKLYYLRNRIGR